MRFLKFIKISFEIIKINIGIVYLFFKLMIQKTELFILKFIRWILTPIANLFEEDNME